MADILPAFPLSLVAFPGEKLNLHIFEPRYRQLIIECITNQITFAIVPYFEGKDFTYATEMKLTQVAKTYDDGKYDIKTAGISLVKVLDFFDKHPNKLYPAIEYEKVTWDDESDVFMNVKIIELITTLYQDMKITKGDIFVPETFKTYQIAHKVGFSIEQELHFLSLSKEKERQAFMLDHLQKLIPIVKDMEEMRKKVEMNGHFKNVIPRK